MKLSLLLRQPHLEVHKIVLMDSSILICRLHVLAKKMPIDRMLKEKAISPEKVSFRNIDETILLPNQCIFTSETYK